MKKNLILTILIVVICSETAVFSESRKSYFYRPQIGVWYGPITPVFSTADHLNTDLGIGMFMRFNLPYDPLKIGIDTSYQYYKSKNIDQMRLVPVYGNLLYLLPLNLPIRIQLKAGAGGCRVYMRPDDVTQWDPLFMIGMEVSFPAGKLINIALRIDYLVLYEDYMKGANKNGYFINSGISLYFNL